jgi:hypothetical protein
MAKAAARLTPKSHAPKPASAEAPYVSRQVAAGAASKRTDAQVRAGRGRIRPKPNLPKPLSTREFREKAEVIVEQLIGLLDQFDGDENLEPSIGFDKGEAHIDDEPHDPDPDEYSLCWTNRMDQSKLAKDCDWLRTDGDAEGPESDKEPSLGSLMMHVGSNQERWAEGKPGDLEEEHDGREDDEREPDCSGDGLGRSIAE